MPLKPINGRYHAYFLALRNGALSRSKLCPPKTGQNPAIPVNDRFGTLFFTIGLRALLAHKMLGVSQTKKKRLTRFDATTRPGFLRLSTLKTGNTTGATRFADLLVA